MELEPDLSLVEEGVRLILRGLGEDLGREGLRDTPSRVARMLAELTSGMRENALAHLEGAVEAPGGGLVVVRSLPFYSLCEHHLLPFFGRAHVAYLPPPGGRVAGVSKVARAVESVSKKLQVQERMTEEIATLLEGALFPEGVMVVLEAEHLCMSMRGVRKPGHLMVTAAARGRFEKDSALRREVLGLLLGRPPGD